MHTHIPVKSSKAYSFLYSPERLKYREILLYGGRGGGKTKELTQFFIIQAMCKKIRVLCLRQYETKVKESLITEFKSFLNTHQIDNKLSKFMLNAGPFVKITADKITFLHNNSEIIFSGVSDNTVEGLKSISNIDFCWVEEAEFLSEFSHRILKPSIRSENSQIFYSFNPKDRNSFMYQKSQNPSDPLMLSLKVNYNDNAFLPSVMELDRQNDFNILPREMYLHIWEGEPLEFNDRCVIDVNHISYFDDSLNIRYDDVILCADTAYSKRENADFSVIGCFGLSNNEIHLLRIFRGRWDFNELQDMMKTAFLWASDTLNRPPSCIIIEKKSSGISLLQELRRTTHLPVREIVPKTDKFSRVSDVLSELHRLRIPLDRTNPLNSWIDEFLAECKMFRADLKHSHDDQVDTLCYALQYFKSSTKVDWDSISNML